jgi:hypothetical protein
MRRAPITYLSQFLALALAGLGSSCLFSQEAERAVDAGGSVSQPVQDDPNLIRAVRVMRPDYAVAMALQDCKQLCQEDPKAALYVRWIMVNEPLMLEFEEGKAVEVTRAGLSYAANTALLHSATVYRPIPNQNGTIFRINLAEYVDFDESKLRLLLDTWDRMQDNQFYLATDKTKLQNTIRYKLKGDSKTYTAVYVKVQIPAVHCNQDGQLLELQKMTNCMVPIISAGQFLRYTFNSDFGGLYPEFRGFDLAPEKGTAEQVFLLRAGVDINNLGLKNADARVVCMGKPTGTIRMVEYVPAAITQPAVGPVIATITRDFFAGFIDQNRHPLENLADRKHDGTEAFLPTVAGGLEFALFQGNGDFVRSAPLNPPNSLAWDSTLPKPFLPILQGPSGCIRCHIENNPSTKIFAIYQPAPNFITWLRDVNVNGYRFDVFADKGDGGKGLKRLVSLYKGETSDAFTWAGRTYAKYAFEASGLPLEQSAVAALTIHDSWLYTYVTPRKMLLTLGYKCSDDLQAVEVFNIICPPAPEPLRVTQFRAWAKDQNGVIRELPMILDDWLALYPEVALRVMKWEQLQTSNSLPSPTKGDFQ